VLKTAVRSHPSIGSIGGTCPVSRGADAGSLAARRALSDALPRRIDPVLGQHGDESQGDQSVRTALGADHHGVRNGAVRRYPRLSARGPWESKARIYGPPHRWSDSRAEALPRAWRFRGTSPPQATIPEPLAGPSRRTRQSPLQEHRDPGVPRCRSCGELGFGGWSVKPATSRDPGDSRNPAGSRSTTRSREGSFSGSPRDCGSPAPDWPSTDLLEASTVEGPGSERSLRPIRPWTSRIFRDLRSARSLSAPVAVIGSTGKMRRLQRNRALDAPCGDSQ
jgi:hypothetical protein